MSTPSWSIPICTLKAGTTITGIEKAFPRTRIHTSHSEDGPKTIDVIADLSAPNGIRVETTEMSPNAIVEITAGTN